MQDLKSFYKNRKVLVTGHTGFKGSWLTIWLNQLGADVVGIALDPKTDRDLFILSGLSENIKDYRQDIRNLDKIREILTQENPEVVFHLAAQALVLPGYEKPVPTFETNIMGTVNILEACRHTPSVKQIVIVTTDKVYENKETMTGYKETDPLGGYDPYSASKAAAEIVTQSYRLSFAQSPNQSINQSIATARAGNVIGGGDWSEYRLIPDCIRSLEAKEPVIVRNPQAVRPWQHVLEPLGGYLLIAIKMSEDPEKYSGPWNFGPRQEDNASVKDVADMMISLWGNGEWNPERRAGDLHEAGLLRLNISKSEDILGWHPVLDFREAVQWTAEWYKAYREADVYKLCMDQIERYTEKWNSGSLK
jgi:CDP-glucose 4,6-dehydratase